LGSVERRATRRALPRRRIHVVELSAGVEFEAQAADSFSNFLDLKESLKAFIPTLGGVGGVASDPQPPVALLHRAEQIIDLCLYRVTPAVAETIAHAPQLLLAVREALKAFPDPPSPL
jgi:hypothetical protein